MEALSKIKIKLIRSLTKKKHRDTEELFIVEGRKSIEDYLNKSPELIEFIVTPEETISSHQHYSADSNVFDSISNLKNGDGFLAVLKYPKINAINNSVILVLDGIQDPGNFGTIIRTAEWFGVDQIICSKDTVDAFNPKVVQATMGSLARVKVTYNDLQELLLSSNLPIYGTLLEGESIYESELLKGYYIIGNEGNGISEKMKELIQNPIHIPGKGKAESLNAAIATGILLGELSRSGIC